MDALGVDGPARNFTISGSAKLGLLDELIAQAKREGRYHARSASGEPAASIRSDHFSFAKLGVPAISFDPGNDLVDGGAARGEALAKDYIANRYHQPADEWTRRWISSAWRRC